MTRSDFVSRFGGVFEHSPWVAEAGFDTLNDRDRLNVETVHQAMVQAFRSASDEERLSVLRAHPDLAGKLAVDGGLTDASKSEQAGAGLDRLTPAEHARFTDLNTRYQARFGFPFIIAVKGLGKSDILRAFEARIDNDSAAELQTAACEVEKIARLRLETMLAEI